MKERLALLTCALLLSWTIDCPAIDVQDSIHAADGTVYSGRIVERYPGIEYHIMTDHGLRVLPVDTIDRIDKHVRRAGDDLHVYTDVVCLRSGLLIAGSIVEESADGITVVTTNGAAVSLPLPEIWRVTHEKRAAIVPPRGIDRNGRIRDLRREFQVELTVRRIEESESAGDEPARVDEVERLREELEELEAAVREAEVEQERDEAYLERVVGGIEETGGEAKAAVAELARRAAACATEDLQATQRIADLYVRATSGLTEVTRLAHALNDADPGVVRDLRIAEEAAAEEQLRATLGAGVLTGTSAARAAEAAALLPTETRRELLRQRPPAVGLNAAAWNALVPIGAGSMRQGDQLGVIVQATTLVAGGLLVLDSIAGAELGAEYELLDWSGYVGLGILAGGYGYSVVRPFLFAGRQNALAREALALGGPDE